MSIMQRKSKSSRINWSRGEYKCVVENAVMDYIKQGRVHARLIARKFNIPWATLQRRLRSIAPLSPNAHVGAPAILNPNIEDAIARHVLQLSEVGFGFSRVQLLEMARAFSPNSSWKPTYGWYYRFMSRYPTLSLRTAEMADSLRGMVTPEAGEAWVKFLETALQIVEEKSNGVKLLPQYISTMDEVGMRLNLSSSRVISLRGARVVHKLTSKNRISNTLVIFYLLFPFNFRVSQANVGINNFCERLCSATFLSRERCSVSSWIP
jgi:hypothetical protein